MELTDLKVFLSVAEEGNVTRAAARMDYVQSNVTSRIRKLEAELGVQLFHRHPKGVTLSNKGEAFREYALAILRMADEAVQVVREDERPSGNFSLGVVETIGMAKLMNVLSDYQTRYPQVSLSMMTGTSPELYSKVINHELDGAFITGNLESSTLHTELVLRDENYLVARCDEAAGEIDWLGQTWVFFPAGCPFRTLAEQWLDSQKAEPTSVIEVSTLESLLGCVRTGLGVSLLPGSALPMQDDQITVKLAAEPYRYMETRLMRRKDRYKTKALSAFIERLHAHHIGVREIVD